MTAGIGDRVAAHDASALIAVVVLTIGFAGATLIVGWWGIPVLAGAWGVWARGRPPERPPARVSAASASAVSAALAWSLLLAWTAVRGPLPQLVTMLGAVLGLPGILLVAATLAFGALLAWSATALVERP